MSEWLQALRSACERHTQAKVARRLGYSAATISQVLAGSYRGNVRAVEAAVRGAFLDEKVRCPVLDEIPRDQCMQHQRRPFMPTNAMRVRLYRACRSGCPHSHLQEDEGEA